MPRCSRGAAASHASSTERDYLTRTTQLKITPACHISGVRSHMTVKLDQLTWRRNLYTTFKPERVTQTQQLLHLKAVQEVEMALLCCCFRHGVCQPHGASSAPPPVMTRHGRRRPPSLGFATHQLDLGLRVAPLEINKREDSDWSVGGC